MSTAGSGLPGSERSRVGCRVHGPPTLRGGPNAARLWRRAGCCRDGGRACCGRGGRRSRRGCGIAGRPGRPSLHRLGPQAPQGLGDRPVRHERQGRARHRRTRGGPARRDHRRHHGDPRPAGWRVRPHRGHRRARRSGGPDPAGADVRQTLADHRRHRGVARRAVVARPAAQRFGCRCRCQRESDRRAPRSSSLPHRCGRRRGSRRDRRRPRAHPAESVRRRRRASRPRSSGAGFTAARAPGRCRARRRRHHAVRDPERQLLPDRHSARGAAGLEGLVESEDRRTRRQPDGTHVRRSPRTAPGRALHHPVVRLQRGRRGSGRQRALARRVAEGHSGGGRAAARRRAVGQPLRSTAGRAARPSRW